jgi:hypothetical protein
MRKAYSTRTGQSSLLLVPGAAVNVWVPNQLIIPHMQNGKLLSAGVYSYGGTDAAYLQAEDNARKKLKRRDWRALREHLLRLNMDDRSSVAEWLSAAGYAPSYDHATWSASDVTNEMQRALAWHRDIFAWMLQLEAGAFRNAVKAAFKWFDEKRAVSGAQLEAGALNKPIPQFEDQEVEFYRRTGAPLSLNFTLLQIFLQGTGQAPVWLAEFRWDRDGVPSVAVKGNSPLEVIGLSIHIDRNFSARQWAFCANPDCGESFERGRGVERFHSATCKNLVLTRRRRKKIRLLGEAGRAWRDMKSAERKRQDRSSWIASWVNDRAGGEFAVTEAWVAKQSDTEKANGKA